MEVIPVVDLSDNDTKNKSIALQIVQALHNVGFVYLKNHGIDQNKITNAFVASKQFFEQDNEQKLRYKYVDNSPKGYHGQGYSIRDGNGVLQVRESFDFTGKMKKHLNDQLNFYEEMQALQEECKPLVKVVLNLLATGLELKDDDNDGGGNHFFLERYKWLNTNPELPSHSSPTFATFRSLYYPAIPQHVDIPQGVLRVKEHSDFDFITFLFQDSIGGLEIKTTSGKWIPAIPIPNTIIVNVGDLLEAWTGSYFPATKHRVLIPESEIKKRIARQSIAYFLHPDSNTLCKPLQSSVIGEYSFKEFKAYEHTKAKLASVNTY